jgi:SAM-dependent methyltransferase
MIPASARPAGSCGCGHRHERGPRHSGPGPAPSQARVLRIAEPGRNNGPMTTPSWDDSYTRSTPAPWDIGRPQPAFLRLAEGGLLAGRLLDAGCGTGENTLLAASRGAETVGVDVSPRAVERARGKAASRGITARFEVADALSLGNLGLTFDTVIDSGLFHVFDDESRARYVASLASVLRPGGHCYLMCFSDRQPGDTGPRRVSEDELRAAFSDGWTVVSIQADTFDVNPGIFDSTTVQAWLAAIVRPSIPRSGVPESARTDGLDGESRRWRPETRQHETAPAGQVPSRRSCLAGTAVCRVRRCAEQQPPACGGTAGHARA